MDNYHGLTRIGWPPKGERALAADVERRPHRAVLPLEIIVGEVIDIRERLQDRVHARLVLNSTGNGYDIETPRLFVAGKEICAECRRPVPANGTPCPYCAPPPPRAS